MPWLQLAVRAINQWLVGIIQDGRRSSDIVVDTVRDRLLAHLVPVSRMHIIQGGMVESGRGHSGIEINQSDMRWGLKKENKIVAEMDNSGPLIVVIIVLVGRVRRKDFGGKEAFHVGIPLGMLVGPRTPLSSNPAKIRSD